LVGRNGSGADGFFDASQGGVGIFAGDPGATKAFLLRQAIGFAGFDFGGGLPDRGLSCGHGPGGLLQFGLRARVGVARPRGGCGGFTEALAEPGGDGGGVVGEQIGDDGPLLVGGELVGEGGGPARTVSGPGGGAPGPWAAAASMSSGGIS